MPKALLKNIFQELDFYLFLHNEMPEVVETAFLRRLARDETLRQKNSLIASNSSLNSCQTMELCNKK